MQRLGSLFFGHSDHLGSFRRLWSNQNQWGHIWGHWRKVIKASTCWGRVDFISQSFPCNLTYFPTKHTRTHLTGGCLWCYYFLKTIIYTFLWRSKMNALEKGNSASKVGLLNGHPHVVRKRKCHSINLFLNKHHCRRHVDVVFPKMVWGYQLLRSCSTKKVTSKNPRKRMRSTQ